MHGDRHKQVITPYWRFGTWLKKRDRKRLRVKARRVLRRLIKGERREW